MNTFENIATELHNRLNGELESVFLTGLERKGYCFSNPMERDEFIKTRVRCEDNVHFKERVYYVDNKSFLLWCYSVDMIPEITNEGNVTKASASYGTFCYL